MGVLKVRKGEILETETDIEYKNSLGQEAEISKGENKSLDLEKNLDKSEHSLDDVRASIEMALVEIGMEAGNGEVEKED